MYSILHSYDLDSRLLVFIYFNSLSYVFEYFITVHIVNLSFMPLFNVQIELSSYSIEIEELCNVICTYVTFVHSYVKLKMFVN